MEERIPDAELKVMKVLWRDGECGAKHIAEVLAKEEGWNINTTYTLIKRCVKRGVIERIEPNFICRAKVSKKEIQDERTNELIDKMFEGSVDGLFAALLDGKKLSRSEIENLKKLVDKLEIADKLKTDISGLPAVRSSGAR